MPIIMAACGRNTQVSETRVMMGTTVTITVAGTGEARAHRAIDRAFGKIEQIESEMGPNGASSEVRRINARTPGEPVPVGRDLGAVILAALDIARASDGAFDPTIGGVTELWGFDGGGRVPDAESLRGAVAQVGWRLIHFDNSSAKVVIDGDSTRIDLGGIAKGFAVDAAARSLVEDGIGAAMIDAGGDLLLIGGKPGRGAWRVGVQDPRNPGALAARMDLRDVAVATSGDYERFFTEGGVRYHHILDPATGMPARGCRSVTVIAPTAMEADACATAAFVLGPERGMDFIRARPGVEAMIIDADGAMMWSDESLEVAE